MYSLLQETDESTTVNFSAYGKFLPGSTSGNQLVTVGAKYLRIFRTNPYALVPPDVEHEDWKQKTKLECVFSTRFLSCVKSFATARIPYHPSCDAFLMAFDDAKLSVVAMDAEERNLVTLSMHSFEDETLKDGLSHNFSPPLLKADPENRCAAMLVYGRQLTVLPFVEGQSYIKSFHVALKQIDQRLENVIDMVFLDGYYEPTLLILYEPLQTTAGRASIRFDSLCIMGVSVNIIDQQFAVVWQMGSLPMDGNRLVPIPKPIGGAVIVGTNDIIYLNQAVPACGIVLNSCYDNFTKFPLKDMKSLALSLDAVACTYLTEGNIVLGTAHGKMYMLTLNTDKANAVKSMDFKEITDISIPFCFTPCAAGHLFLGSRLGDSQLFQYSLTSSGTTEEKVVETVAKKQKLDLAFDDEDLELYGNAETVDEPQAEEVQQKEDVWVFQELDTLKNVAPIKTITAGGAHNTSSFLLEEERNDPMFDLVGASGHGTDGALTIFQRTVRPEVMNSSTIESAQQMWAVGQHEDGSHKYLIVSRIRSTLVLELGEEMVELEEPLFISSEPTVAAGELADGGLAVQVTSMCMALVADDKQLQQIQIDSNFPVVAASIVDPYVVLLTQNGRLLLYKLVVHPHVHLKEIQLGSSFTTSSSVPVTAFSIYKDLSGIMVCSTGGSTDKTNNVRSDTTTSKSNSYQDMSLDDAEDFLLYGDTSSKKNSKAGDGDTTRKRKHGGVTSEVTGGEESDAIDPNTVNPTYWLVLARDNGRMAIYSLPDMTIVFQVRKFSGMPSVLLDFSEVDDEKERKEAAAENERKAKEGEGDVNQEVINETVRQDERVVEIEIIGMGISQCRPMLMAVIDDMLIVYEMYAISNSQAEHLCIAFRRMPLTICLRSSAYMGPDGRRTEVQLGRESDLQRRIIHPFERISNIMHGVLIGGAYPSLVLVGAWGGLRHHPITVDGAIRSFTPFNNEMMANGFLYLTDTDQQLRIAQLPKGFDYEMPYPCMKVPVGKTVHYVRYLMESQLYAVVTSVPKKSNKIWVVVNDDKQEEIHEKPDDFVLPSIPHFTLNLYSTEDWSPIPNTSIEFEDMEHVSACEEVALRSESTISGLKTYLAVGTINNYGEEHLVRGRIILAEIIEVVPEPGMPTSKNKIKVIYDAEQKSPVTSICAINGFLLTGMGQKIFIWGLKDNEIQGVSFLDMHYFVHSLISFRSMAIACDVQDSISLVRFQEQFKALSIASRDDRLAIQPPMQAQYLVDNNHLAFLLSDEAGNICMFNYMPEAKESCGGEKMVLRAALNIGTNVNTWIRIKGNAALTGLSLADQKFASNQQTTVWASLDGSFGYVRPITEKSFRRFSFLHQFMTIGLKHAAGLNPKGARSAKPPRPTINNANQKNMIDGDLVSQFLHLSTAEKQDIARRFGASRYHILDDLIQMQRLATYY